MKCVIPGANVKILAKAIHALAKIGDEMYIEPQTNVLSFRTVNMANSAYADFSFSQSYFSYYIYGDLPEDDALKCKISMRSAMTVFKAMNLIDKQVETCHIRLEADASEILFILKYKNSITKTHLLPILDSEKLRTSFDKDRALIKVSSQSRVLGDAIQNFHQYLTEITLEVTAQKLLLRNYVDDGSGLSNTTRTQLALAKGEFDRYEIGSESSITFCMKEFKSMLSFAENVGAPVSIYFEGAGRPVIFALKNPSFEVNLVMSTLSADTESQTDTTLLNKQEKTVRKKAANRRAPRKGNKSMSTLQGRSTTMATASLKRTLLMEEQKQKEQNNLTVDLSNTSERNNENAHESICLEQNAQEGSQRNFSSNCDTSTKSASSGKKLVNSIFSSITKRKSNNDETDRRNSTDKDKSVADDVLEDEVPSSPHPPNKRARLIFQKCFQTTFDPRTLPGYNVVLAEDSDECCE